MFVLSFKDRIKVTRRRFGLEHLTINVYNDYIYALFIVQCGTFYVYYLENQWNPQSTFNTPSQTVSVHDDYF